MFYQPNREEVLRRCGNGLVLDVGGWGDPFPRADHVLDCFRYETRGLLYHGIGRIPDTVTYPDPLPGERFSRDTWAMHDICGSKPFPYPDKMFDFVVCSHTLEDVRDPLRVCGELIRVGKAGYIETPSRLVEQTVGFLGQVGAPHHRWLVEMEGNRIDFTLKSTHFHIWKDALIPLAFTHRQPLERHVSWLFWEGSFGYGERIVDDLAEDARRFARRFHVPASARLRQAASTLRRRLRGSPGDELPSGTAQDGTWTWPKLLKASLPEGLTLVR